MAGDVKHHTYMKNCKMAANLRFNWHLTEHCLFVRFHRWNIKQFLYRKFISHHAFNLR